MELLAEERGTKSPLIRRLSQRHHALARLLATGMPQGEAALCAGYSISRVSILSADPSFKELVTFYKEAKDEQVLEMQERISGLSADALEELRERLEEDPESFSNTMLLEIATKFADRSGHGPTSTNTNVNVNVNMASRLEAARKRVAQARTIEGEVVDADGRPQALPEAAE